MMRQSHGQSGSDALDGGGSPNIPGGGFSADMTHHAYHAIDSHITGFTLWQVSMPFETKEELVDMAEGFLKEIPVDQYPYVIEHAEQHLAPSSPTARASSSSGST
jgi:hypothetical protein